MKYLRITILTIALIACKKEIKTEVGTIGYSDLGEDYTGFVIIDLCPCGWERLRLDSTGTLILPDSLKN